jgi:amino acid transporter
VTPIAAMLVTLSCLGSVGAWLGAVARIPFVAGIDHYLPKAFGRMHPRWGSPVVALLAQAGIASIFVFLGQGGNTVKVAYDTLVGSTLIITFIPFLLLFASAIKLHAEPSPPQAARIPGGAFTVVFSAIVGFLTTLGGIVLACVPPDDVSDKTLFVLKIAFLTALMVGGGAAVYVIGRRRQRIAPVPTL